MEDKIKKGDIVISLDKSTKAMHNELGIVTEIVFNNQKRTGWLIVYFQICCESLAVHESWVQKSFHKVN